MKTIAIADIQKYVGVESSPTEWFSVKQSQINLFADCTLDHQYIHIDDEKAKNTPFAGTIAHGMLSLSMLPHFCESFGYILEGTHFGVNYGFDKVRFLHPVKVNSKIRAHSKLIDVIEKNQGQFLFKTDVSVEIEGESTPALVATWLVMQMVIK